MEILWEVFPELSGNPRDSTIVPLATHSFTHTRPSTTHYSTPSITPTTISHIHPQTISCTKITSNNTSESTNTTLSTIPPTISTTTTSFIEPVNSPKQQKRRPPTLDIFPSRDFRLKRYKEYSSPFTQLQTILTTATTSNFEPRTTISTTATKPHPKCKTLPPTSPQPTATHSTSATGKHLPSKKRHHSHFHHYHHPHRLHYYSTNQDICSHEHQHQPPS